MEEIPLPRNSLDKQSALPSFERRNYTENIDESALSMGYDYQISAAHSLVEMIAQQADSTPDMQATIEGGRILHYGELNARANQLAHCLHSLGVQPRRVIGVCLGRSIDLVVGLLGILKAGSAYLALDPAYPLDRLSFMLDDAGTSAVVTTRALADRLSAPGRKVMCLDDWEPFARFSTNSPAVHVSADDLAYVVYTSGSTGQPKGVLVPHSGLLNLIAWHQRAFAVTPSDRATQIASPAFDALGWEIWPYLTRGASVYIVDEETRLDPQKLRDWLIAHEITISFLPTVLAESVMRLEWPKLSALRVLLTGADSLQNYPDQSLPFTLVNNYGPAEATVVTTSGVVPCSSDMSDTSRPPTIGSPIDNISVHLLDEQRQPVPLGTVGEIYIGGAGVAKGYLNQPELTAERFVPDPWNDAPQARLYKTGDLARVLPDGQIEFIGRSDFQIKIRGIRVEPREIEALLCQQPEIQASIVIARDDPSGEKQLVAYIVVPQDAHISAGTLRSTLAASLPKALVPAVFVRLEALPISPNGKLDRGRLPEPDATNIVSDEIHAEPATEVERHIADIVTRLLQIDRIDLDDNFFLHGGHSLLGTQIVMQLVNSFDVDLPLRVLFEAPTVRQLAGEVERRLYVNRAPMSEDEAQVSLG
jgi:amino acid adenylation domain-containing protein